MDDQLHALGYDGIPYDVLRAGAQQDLGPGTRARATVLAALREGRYVAAFIGLPCDSYTCARANGPYAKPLRAFEHPHGGCPAYRHGRERTSRTTTRY